MEACYATHSSYGWIRISILRSVLPYKPGFARSKLCARNRFPSARKRCSRNKSRLGSHKMAGNLFGSTPPSDHRKCCRNMRGLHRRRIFLLLCRYNKLSQVRKTYYRSTHGLQHHYRTFVR